jgi:hypothetical protein
LKNREENQSNNQKCHIQLGRRSQEENVMKLGSKLVLVPGFSAKNSASAGVGIAASTLVPIFLT